MSKSRTLGTLVLAGVGVGALVGVYALQRSCSDAATPSVSAVTYKEALVDPTRRQAYLEQLVATSDIQTTTKIAYEHKYYSDFLNERRAPAQTYGLPQAWQMIGHGPYADTFIAATTLLEGELVPREIGKKSIIYVFKPAFSTDPQALQDPAQIHSLELGLKGQLVYNLWRAIHLSAGIFPYETAHFRLSNGSTNMPLFDLVSALVAKEQEYLFYLDAFKRESGQPKEFMKVNMAGTLIFLDRRYRDIPKVLEDANPRFVEQLSKDLAPRKLLETFPK